LSLSVADAKMRALMGQVDPPPIEALSASDLAQALALSAAAQWNQNEHDWHMVLALGQGWGLRAVDEQGLLRLAASVIVLPYGEAFAWVSMVLVWPAFQRRGYASQLLRHALQFLQSRGTAAVLDATPAGHAVYAREGFADDWGFARYRREPTRLALESAEDPPTRSLRESDWPAILALDTPAFGASRAGLLRSLAARWPQAARVVEQGGRLRGFVLGRDGREAHQVGPLVADDAAVAQSLVADALRNAPGAAYLDLIDDRKAALLPWLQHQGFVFQRPFTRMVRGAPDAPGDTSLVFAVAGPELG
jgi:GNAT superfamily N-acetyltransferase